MIISFIIWHHQLRIKVLILIDNEVFKYVFINVIFAQKHHLSLHYFCYFCCFEEFDDQSAFTDVITHVVKITLAFNHYVEKMFFYVTDLKQYLIVLNHSWFRKHDIISKFDNNILILIFQFYLKHCISFFIKVSAVISEKSNFFFLSNFKKYNKFRISKSSAWFSVYK